MHHWMQCRQTGVLQLHTTPLCKPRKWRLLVLCVEYANIRRTMSVEYLLHASNNRYNLRKRCVECLGISILKKIGPGFAGIAKACQGGWQAFGTSKAVC